MKYGIPGVTGADDRQAKSKNKARVYGVEAVGPVEIPD
jgi:hypothetical protein